MTSFHCEQLKEFGREHVYPLRDQAHADYRQAKLWSDVLKAVPWEHGELALQQLVAMERRLKALDATVKMYLVEALKIQEEIIGADVQDGERQMEQYERTVKIVGEYLAEVEQMVMDGRVEYAKPSKPCPGE